MPVIRVLKKEFRTKNTLCVSRPRGEEKEEKIKNLNFKARRWVVEVTHSFFNRFRKLLVRYEKKARNYLALIHFACAIIVWRKIIPVHKQ